MVQGFKAHVLRFMNYGSWFRVHCSWFTIHNKWFTVHVSLFMHGSWFTIHDSCFMVYFSSSRFRLFVHFTVHFSVLDSHCSQFTADGSWYMVLSYGKWCTVHGSQFTVHGSMFRVPYSVQSS